MDDFIKNYELRITNYGGKEYLNCLNCLKLENNYELRWKGIILYRHTILKRL